VYFIVCSPHSIDLTTPQTTTTANIHLIYYHYPPPYDHHYHPMQWPSLYFVCPLSGPFILFKKSEKTKQKVIIFVVSLLSLYIVFVALSQ